MGKDPLYDFIQSRPKIPYDQKAKNEFKRRGSNFFTAVLREMRKKGISASHLGYNKGGIAISGELTLMVMFQSKKGVAIYLAEPHGEGEWVMARSITDFNDHTGGENVWINNNRLEAPKKLSEYLFERFA